MWSHDSIRGAPMRCEQERDTAGSSGGTRAPKLTVWHRHSRRVEQLVHKWGRPPTARGAAGNTSRSRSDVAPSRVIAAPAVRWGWPGGNGCGGCTPLQWPRAASDLLCFQVSNRAYQPRRLQRPTCRPHSAK